MSKASFAAVRNFAGVDITVSAVRAELERVVTSSGFSHSLKMRRFLTYVVDETLAEREAGVKEYTIGLNVYDKPAQFDPRTDSIIRVEANRLRSKLEKYYAAEGRSDPVVIQLPKNGYVPRFYRPGNRPIVTPSTSDWEVDYLKGKHFLNRRDPEAVQQAIRCFTLAATEERAFSRAMAGLADCYATLACFESGLPEPLWSQAVLYARRALGQKPPFEEALTALACENAVHRWDWLTAEQQFRKVIKSDSAHIAAYQMYAMFCLAPQGRLDEAVFYLQRAQEFEPNSAVTSAHLGRIFYFNRRYGDALRELNHAVRLNPRLLAAYSHLGLVYAQIERWDEASAALSAGLNITTEPYGIAVRGYIDGLLRRDDAALESRTSLRQTATTRYVSPVSFALIEIGLGNTDAAFEYLHSALETKAAQLVHLAVDPVFDRIKTDPRFVRLLWRMGL